MKLQSEWVDFDAGGKPAQGYSTRPAMAKGPLPGLVVIQEVFGVDPHIQDIANRLAMAGYAVFAPDLYTYGGRRPELAPQRIEDVKAFLDTMPTPSWFDNAKLEEGLARYPEAQARSFRETLGTLLDPNRPWPDYLATVKGGREWLSHGPAKGREVGALGFCMGGSLALRLASADAQVAAVATCYGFTPPQETLTHLKAPVLGLYAEDDARVNGSVPALVDLTKEKGVPYERHTFAGAKHAFLNDTRSNYDAEAARGAWAKLLTFFDARLSPRERAV
ncbi:dienelactone hydrolase family protein [Corallococcus sp. Z5C101001]|uniref:dienelactone hydrolase family protein n=1 Tax=Corallococcus sp. Z5C101001 TaxID=2596829 RepID=UPI00118070F0|nr:dienelactone hydrolase family protein [Corallococcus sp. Z5C101001]TSC29345.1 dienelactone hydrolase family protein [Corallococcus sp. Z5C101001]